MDELLARITIDNDKCGGRPCIRGLRIRVIDVLGMLVGGDTPAAIVEAHPDLEADDVRACLAYAARELDHAVLVSAA